MRTDLPEEPVVTEKFEPNQTMDLPQKVDLRKYMTPVEDQSNSNSCCANAVAGAYEYMNRKHAEATGCEPGDVSRLFIYYVGRKKDMVDEAKLWGGTNPKAARKDEGMGLGAAISAIQMTGACLANSWPCELDKLVLDHLMNASQRLRSTKLRRPKGCHWILSLCVGAWLRAIP